MTLCTKTSRPMAACCSRAKR